MNEEEYILNLIRNDEWKMSVLKSVKKLNLPDWWVCAGFVRSKVWDELHGFSERTELGDIDVIYFDIKNIDEEREKAWEEELKALLPGLPWSVKNQARMHEINRLSPYTSSEDAISKFPETATALGVKMDEENQLVLTAPCGTTDLFQMKVKPTVHFVKNARLATVYGARLQRKNWKEKWPKLKIYSIEDCTFEKEHETK